MLLWLPTVSTVTDCGGALGAVEEAIRINTNCKSWCTLMVLAEYKSEDKKQEILFSSILTVHIVFKSDSFYKIYFKYNGWI